MSEYLKTLLNAETRLSLKDGRILEGILVCIDRQENFVLNDATGFREDLDFPQMLLVPGRFVTRIEVLQK